jgi:hypothetical protein
MSVQMPELQGFISTDVCLWCRELILSIEFPVAVRRRHMSWGGKEQNLNKFILWKNLAECQIVMYCLETC